MNNNYNLNWYNYKSFEPKDMSNYGLGYSYKPIDYADTNFYPNYSLPTATPQYAPYAGNDTNSNKSWGNRAWDGTKSLLPQSYGEAGALLSGVGSIWGAIAGAKAAKEANQRAKDNLEEIKRRNKKIDDDNEKFAKSIDSVWNRE